jgi:anaerobic carbon-monoxide dehydrogenase iron sulfur subunit
MIIQAISELCTGCRACEVYCSLAHEGVIDPFWSRIDVLQDAPHDVFIPIVCPPCVEKACIAACPESGAIVEDPSTGAVRIVEENCTACSKCIAACEIGAIKFIKQTGRGKKAKAVAIKCDQCDGDPWCVKVCQPGALNYVEQSSLISGQGVFEHLRAMRERADIFLTERGSRPKRKVRVV